MNIIQQLEKEQAERLAAKRPVPEFSPGDTVVVAVRVTEGERSRIQNYEGVVIARSGGGLNESFNVNTGLGVELVNFMRVYDRWGELMYERERFLPNTQRAGNTQRIGQSRLRQRLNEGIQHRITPCWPYRRRHISPCNNCSSTVRVSLDTSSTERDASMMR